MRLFFAGIAVYDEKQQATIQRAIDSGILNNTNRTHEFVDLIAKISADKGVLFDFTSNENLKNFGFALEGRYAELQKLVIDYAKMKGEYDTRLSSVKEIYKDIKDADVNAELVADLIGDYLFTDEKFLKRLYAENPNFLKKIYEEIKYLVKKATAGSKQARQLLEVQKAFEKAYKESTKNSAEGTRYFLNPEMIIDVRKMLPEAVGIPIIVMQSKTAKDSITLYGEVYATVEGEQQPVMVAMLLSPQGKSGRILELEKISSAYVQGAEEGKGKSEYIKSKAHFPKLLKRQESKHQSNNYH